MRNNQLPGKAKLMMRPHLIQKVLKRELMLLVPRVLVGCGYSVFIRHGKGESDVKMKSLWSLEDVLLWVIDASYGTESRSGFSYFGHGVNFECDSVAVDVKS